MEIYIKESEMPKSCNKCLCKVTKYWLPLSTRRKGIYCQKMDKKIVQDLPCEDEDFKFDNCPLKSIEQHDKEVREQAIKEFAERLKEMAYQSTDWSHGVHPMVVEVDYIDEIVEEMTK